MRSFISCAYIPWYLFLEKWTSDALIFLPFLQLLCQVTSCCLLGNNFLPINQSVGLHAHWGVAWSAASLQARCLRCNHSQWCTADFISSNVTPSGSIPDGPVHNNVCFILTQWMLFVAKSNGRGLQWLLEWSSWTFQDFPMTLTNLTVSCEKEESFIVEHFVTSHLGSFYKVWQCNSNYEANNFAKNCYFISYF